jgi:hypothetical protein
MPLPLPAAGPEFYVSPPPAGVAVEDAPTGSGTFEDPFHSIAHAIRQANGGGTVYLRAGQYVESIDVTGIGGTGDRPIVVRPRNLERVTIDATVLQFRGPTPNKDWKPVPGQEGEFISTARFDPTPGAGSTVVSAGAFIDRKDPETGRDRHTRLVSYDRLEDLRSPNQLWPDPVVLGKNPDQLGENVAHEELHHDDATGTDVPFSPDRRYRPYVYMGPGIWFDERTGADGRRVHIRLSPTTNQIDGWPDYTGQTDPTRLRLALSTDESHVLRLVTCQHMRFENLTMRFGGIDTIRLRNCADIVFDHITIWAGSRAIRLENDSSEELNQDIEFKHCEIDGGLPTWFFRSDRKDQYRFRPGPGQPVVTNLLGHATGGVLISSDPRARAIAVHHCEILNGHDVAVAFGYSSNFHHNWVHNINDDGLIMTGTPGTEYAKVYRNAITQCLTGMSFAGDQVKQIYIFRNLFDLRKRTLGNRPRKEGEQHSLRQSQFFKDGADEGPFDLFHNTCLVLDPGGIGDPPDGIVAAAFGHYGSTLDDHQGRRRAFNNIFVAVYSEAEKAKLIAFLPPNTFAGPTDGNLYHRLGTGTDHKFLVPGEEQYADLGTYNAAEPPYEKDGRLEDPLFLSFDASDGAPLPSDDLRLQANSPAKDSPVTMPDELESMDKDASGLGWFYSLLPRDRGCYYWAGDRLRVGVKGRRRFPPPPQT